ncbi:hypothetical protein H2202_007824 [Exophiala xenobiotica]|nr:hypothetical protein H2202_007824 [Exophiala xenobiotica]
MDHFAIDWPMNLDIESQSFQPQSQAALLAGVQHDSDSGRSASLYLMDHFAIDWPMNLDIESQSIQPQSRAALLAGVPHDKKWSLLKDLLEPLFYTHKVKDIARIMKEQHGFSAKFVNWNMPLAASKVRVQQSYTPPFGFPSSTPDGVILRTPSTCGESPPRDTSSHDIHLPLSVAVVESIALDRARLFLHGKFDDLANTLNDAEKTMMSTWLYQFWLFAFVTSKNRGKGPRDRTGYNLDFNGYERFPHQPPPGSPPLLACSPVDVQGHEDAFSRIQMPSQLCQWSIHTWDDSSTEWSEDRETDEDSWDDPSTEWPSEWEDPPLEERLQNALENNDFSNIESATLPMAMSQVVKAVKRSPNELLLESFCFSIMARNQLLVAQMLEKVKVAGLDVRSTYPLHIATSYLDGGSTCCNILELLCDRGPGPNASLIEFDTNDHVHTVLDNLMLTIMKGHSRSSPDILDESLTQDSRFAGIEVDLCGRWDADSLCFRAFLQSGKTQVPPNWKHKFCHTSTLAVCHCIQSLESFGLIRGSSGLFVRRCFSCGLSLQLSPFHVLVLTTFHLARSGCEGEDLFGMIAVLLCMLTTAMNPKNKVIVSIDLLLGIDDGIRCTHEALRPIDLADRLPSKIIDGWSAELQRGWQIFCHLLRPSEHNVDLSNGQETFFEESAQDIRGDLISEPTSEDDLISKSTSDDLNCICKDGNFRRECDEDCHEISAWRQERYPGRLPSQDGKRSDIAHIWAAVQTELHTYRRIHENDSWLSPYFDLDALLTSLQTGAEISMPLLDRSMIRPYCCCGRTRTPWYPALREDMEAYDFSNMDVRDRASFIPIPPYEPYDSE